MLELPDGRLLGAVRLEKPQPYTILTAYSEDGGKSWTEPARTDVSGAPPHLLRHSSGALICTYGRRELPYGQRAMVSYDEGKTWAEEYVLTENTVARDLGYGSTVELADGSLLSVYYEKFPGDEHASILYTKWALKP